MYTRQSTSEETDKNHSWFITYFAAQFVEGYLWSHFLTALASAELLGFHVIYTSRRFLINTWIVKRKNDAKRWKNDV